MCSGFVLLMANGGCASTPPSPAADSSATVARPSTKAVMLVQKEQQLRIALGTAKEMLRGTHLAAQAVEVVVCGEASSSLLERGPLDTELRAAHDAGVRIVACGISLERGGIDRATLSRAVEVVDNGLIEVFQRQSEGYLSIEL
ncbi:hypothetical protein AKJ09_06916 [Labilithrix luteola]|uniref:Uncharacterized protein n=1 Tax=Labilithrix luteola TaxID=1391654 RepID=A0A0K1Q3F0_9BACT|nr:hypothetical protein AKJ09_06916 [Labilithrix luteola]